MDHPIYRVVDFDIVGPHTLQIHFDDGMARTICFQSILVGSTRPATATAADSRPIRPDDYEQDSAGRRLPAWVPMPAGRQSRKVLRLRPSLMNTRLSGPWTTAWAGPPKRPLRQVHVCQRPPANWLRPVLPMIQMRSWSSWRNRSGPTLIGPQEGADSLVPCTAPRSSDPRPGRQIATRRHQDTPPRCVPHGRRIAR